MNDLSGQVAIVTGGTGGIGRGVARRLASRGAKVAVGGRSAEKAEVVMDELRRAGADVFFAAGDVRSKEDMESVVARTVEHFGRVDIVVANAGGDDATARSTQVRGPFADIDLAQVTSFAAQALASKLLVVQAAVPAMRRNGGGSVVFVTSEGGRVPTPGQTAIASFSGGLIMASKVLAKELAPDRIRVNTVCVTVVRDSPSWDAAFGPDPVVSERHRRQYEKAVERSPLGVADPDGIGSVVAFLASSQAQYLTGAVMSPTGGLTIH